MWSKDAKAELGLLGLVSVGATHGKVRNWESPRAMARGDRHPLLHTLPPSFLGMLACWDILAFGLHCVIDKSSISSVQLCRAQLAIGARPYITVAA